MGSLRFRRWGLEFVRGGEFVRIYGRSKPLPYRGRMEFVRGRGGCAEMECTRAPSVFLLRKNPPPSRREANGRFAPEGGGMEFVRRGEFVRDLREERAPPLPWGKWSSCADGSVGREDEGAVSLPQRGKVARNARRMRCWRKV